VARQHFARDLGIARLVSADQADQLQSEKEQESTKGDEGQGIGSAARAFVQAGRSWSQ
jgi:hypothetical protein